MKAHSNVSTRIEYVLIYVALKLGADFREIDLPLMLYIKWEGVETIEKED